MDDKMSSSAWRHYPQLRTLFPLALSVGGCHISTAEFYLQMGMNISPVIINILHLQWSIYKSFRHPLTKELNLATLQPAR